MNTAARAQRLPFDGLTILVHWTTAILVLGLFLVAWVARGRPRDGEAATRLLTLHRSLERVGSGASPCSASSGGSPRRQVPTVPGLDAPGAATGGEDSANTASTPLLLVQPATPAWLRASIAARPSTLFLVARAGDCRPRPRPGSPVPRASRVGRPGRWRAWSACTPWPACSTPSSCATGCSRACGPSRRPLSPIPPPAPPARSRRWNP